MAMAHPTTEVEQHKTDTFIVLDQMGGNGPNMDYLGRIEVPRYSQPTSDGVRLDIEKQRALAVYRLLEHDDTAVVHADSETPISLDILDGVRFGVMGSIDGEIHSVEYEYNPAFDAVWDPATDGSGSHVSESERSDDDCVWDPESES